MNTLGQWLKALECWRGRCPGHVVAGWRDGVLHVGWRCRECGDVQDYEPAHPIAVRRDPTPYRSALPIRAHRLIRP